MQRYIKVAFETRGLDPDFDPKPMCERCKIKRSDDVDHVYGRRGDKMLDPYNLIFLCRPCHINKGGFDRKKKAEEIINNSIRFT